MNPYRNEVTFMNENLVETKKIAIDNLTVEITRNELINQMIVYALSNMDDTLSE